MGSEFKYLYEQDMLNAGVANMEKRFKYMEDMFILLYKGDYRMGKEQVTVTNADGTKYLVEKKVLERTLYDFLKCINYDFPIPLNQKTNLNDYVKKIIKCGEIVVCQEENILKGVVLGYTNNLENSSAYISVVGIRKEFRGKHIGRRTVQMFIDICKQKNINTLSLYTHKSNIRAIGLYEALGFKKDVSTKDGRAQDIHFVLQL